MPAKLLQALSEGMMLPDKPLAPTHKVDALVSIGFLALGYMRSASGEFVFSLDVTQARLAS